MKYVADAMLGRLAKWLRALGVDTHYQTAYEPGKLYKLIRDGRELITKNRKTASQYPGSILVKTNRVEDQLKELKKEGHIPFPSRPFSLCLRCNTPLQIADLTMAKPFVPEYILINNVGKIRYCPKCQRFYWPGTHRSRMETLLKAWGLLEEQ